MRNSFKFLDFESFKREKNNFHLFFVPNNFGYYYRKTEVYKRCMKEKENIFAGLAYNLRLRDDYSSPSYLLLLYKAYKIMRLFAKDDVELFQ